MWLCATKPLRTLVRGGFVRVGVTGILADALFSAQQCE